MFSSRKASPPAFDSAYQATSFEEDDNLPPMPRGDNPQAFAQAAVSRPVHDPDILAQTEMARQYAGEVSGMRGNVVPAAEEDVARLCIGKAIKMKGSVEDCGVLQVDGQFEASAQSNELKVAESGTFVGEADVHNAEIIGRFDGDLTVKDKLVIRSTGVVTGTIRYGSIEIAAGGKISGDIQAILKNEPPPVQVNSPPAPEAVAVPQAPPQSSERKPLRLNLADSQPDLSDAAVSSDTVAPTDTVSSDSVAPAQQPAKQE